MTEKRKKLVEESVENTKRGKKELLQDTLDQIKQLEAELRLGTKFVNNLTPLVKLCEETSSSEILHATIVSLKRVFIAIGIKKSIPISNDNNELTATETVDAWIREKYICYLNVLLKSISHKQPGVQMPALVALLELVKKETLVKSEQNAQYTFANDLYSRVVQSILMADNLNEHLLDAVIDKHLLVYDDLRYYFFKNSAKLLLRFREKLLPMPFFAPTTTERYAISAHFIDNISICLFRLKFPKSPYQNIFCNVPGMTENHAYKDHQKVFTDAWMAFLALDLPPSLTQQVLTVLHSLMPYFANPCLLMDFLTAAYDHGGIFSLLSLNSLFILMTKYNLDYPAFYDKLYARFDLSLMHSQYRGRFFRMADLFLSSTHLPAYLIAAFMKRMARLALLSPPGAILVLIPMIFNLLRRHSSCAVLIHSMPASVSPFSDLLTESPSSKSAALEISKGSILDPYNFTTHLTADSHALESSLYELQLLRNHYCPAVSSLMKIFEHPLQPPKAALPLYSLDALADASYSSVMEIEMQVDATVAKPATSFNVREKLFDVEFSNGVLTL